MPNSSPLVSPTAIPRWAVRPLMRFIAGMVIQLKISNIMNFMNNSWGNKLPMITPYDVEDALQDCPEY